MRPASVCSVRLTQVSLTNLERVQRMLARLGIESRIYRDRKPAGLKAMPRFCAVVWYLAVVSRARASAAASGLEAWMAALSVAG